MYTPALPDTHCKSPLIKQHGTVPASPDGPVGHKSQKYGNVANIKAVAQIGEERKEW